MQGTKSYTICYSKMKSQFEFTSSLVLAKGIDSATSMSAPLVRVHKWNGINKPELIYETSYIVYGLAHRMAIQERAIYISGDLSLGCPTQ